MIEQRAPAKINLCLHVTGQRSDGYHLLDSLVLFTEFGDRVSIVPDTSWTLNCTGPFGSDVPQGSDNLVLRAATIVSEAEGAVIRLEKNLPPSSGIGGGSSDAAATIRALSKIYPSVEPTIADLVKLGADVPVWMSNHLTRMQGIGDQLTRLGPPSSIPIILVNPGVSLSTADVFNALETKENLPLPETMPNPADLSNWLGWLGEQRNDLEQPAIKLQPEIAKVLGVLSAFPETKLARMSGSGATCFAILEDSERRDAVAALIRKQHPNWWLVATQSYRGGAG